MHNRQPDVQMVPHNMYVCSQKLKMKPSMTASTLANYDIVRKKFVQS